MSKTDVSRVLDYYPRIYFACHTRHITDKDTGVKLTANQGSILDHLDKDEPVSLYDLAIHMGVTPSTMSISIEKLVKLAYVSRKRDESDARKTNLTLTAAGHKIKESNSVLDPAAVEAILSRLSVNERKLAVDGLGLLAYAAEMEMKSKSLGKSWNNRKSKK